MYIYICIYYRCAIRIALVRTTKTNKLKLWARKKTPTECGKKWSLSPNGRNMQCKPSFSCIRWKFDTDTKKSSYIIIYIYIQKQKSLVFRFQDCVSRLEYSYLNLNEFMAVQYGSCIFFTTTFPASEPGSDTVPSSFSAEKAHPVPTKSIARPAISTTSVLLLLQQSCLPGTMIFNTG